MKRRQVENKLILGIIIAGIALISTIVIVCLSNIGKKQIDDDRVTVENTEERQVKHIDIETPYVTLEFPKEMSKQVKSEVSDKTETGAYTVSFYGTLENKEKIHLSDLIFGGEEGYTVGYLTTEDGKEPIAVNIKYYDAEDDSWSDDELIQIQEMQSGVEHVIDMLVESGKLELAK